MPATGIVASEPSVGQRDARRASTPTFNAPPATSIVGYRLWRTIRLQPNWNYTLYRRAPTGQEQDIVERCWTIERLLRRSVTPRTGATRPT